MVEMILAGVIIAAVAAVAAVTGVRDWRRRRELRRSENAGPGRSEPIPSGWTPLPTPREGEDADAAEPCPGGAGTGR